MVNVRRPQVKNQQKKVDEVAMFGYAGHRSSLAILGGRGGGNGRCSLNCDHLMSLSLLQDLSQYDIFDLVASILCAQMPLAPTLIFLVGLD